MPVRSGGAPGIRKCPGALMGAWERKAQAAEQAPGAEEGASGRVGGGGSTRPGACRPRERWVGPVLPARES